MGNIASKIDVQWLVKIGKERALLWSVAVKSRGHDPFIVMIRDALLADGQGDAFASSRLELLMFRAIKAGKHLFNYLRERTSNEENWRKLYEELGLGVNTRLAIPDIVRLEEIFNTRKVPPYAIDSDELYNYLRTKVRGLGEWLENYIMYDLIRIFGFKVPKNLTLSSRIKKKLEKLNIDTTEIKKEDYPYIDAALFDYPD